MKNQRPNIYTLIHKALRAEMAQTLVDLGRIDDADADAVAQQLRRVEALLDDCQHHLEHENRYIHSAILAADDGIQLATVADHAEHEASIRRLRAAVAGIGAADQADLAPALLELYRNLALFVGENFSHMQVEETAITQCLWDHFTDAQILEIERQIVSSLTPEDRNRITLMMLTCMSHSERLAMLTAMRPQMPGAVFDEILGAVKPAMTAACWQRLRAGLGRNPNADAAAA